MSKSRTGIAIIGDPHISDKRDFIGQYRVNTLASAIGRLSTDNQIGCIIITGDLFDTVVVGPAVVCAVSRMLETETAWGTSTRCYVLSGNHDSSVSRGYALDYLPRVRAECDVSIVNFEGIFIGMVPYNPESTAEASIIRLGMLAETRRGSVAVSLVVGHFGLYSDIDGRHNPWMKKDPWFVDVSWLREFSDKCPGLRGARYVCGHRHSYYESDDKRFISVGALSPTKVSEAGSEYGNLVVYGTESVDVKKNYFPGIRYGDGGCNTGNCVVHTEAQDSVVYTDPDLAQHDVSELAGKIILMERGIGGKQRISLAFDAVDDPTDLNKLSIAVAEYANEMIRVDRLKGSPDGLVDDAVKLLYGQDGISDKGGVFVAGVPVTCFGSLFDPIG